MIADSDLSKSAMLLAEIPRSYLLELILISIVCFENFCNRDFYIVFCELVRSIFVSCVKINTKDPRISKK